MTDTGIIILAAGSSSRLGRPKQLLPFQNSLLIEHIIDEALSAELNPVVVVTGANAEAVSLSLKNKPVTLVHNERWEEGMGTSIKAGLSKSLMIGAIDNVIIAVCDQPFVSAHLFKALVQMKKKSGKGIVACAYAGTIGTPVLFSKDYFSHLQNLNASEGAKGLVNKYKNEVAIVSFPKGNIDIDTEEDYKKMNQQNDQTYKE